MDELNRTPNSFRCVGWVLEKFSRKQNEEGGWDKCPMEIVDTERDEYKEGQPTGNKIPCQRLNGTIVIKHKNRCTTQVNVNIYSKNADGEKNRFWPMAESISEWVAQIDDNRKEPAVPDFVAMQGNITGNWSTNRAGKAVCYVQYNATRKCERVDPSENDAGLSVNGVFYVKKIAPETYTRNGEEVETGRAKLDLVFVNGRGEIFDYPAFVDDDGKGIVEAMLDNLEAGDTIEGQFYEKFTVVNGNSRKKNTTRKLPSANVKKMKGDEVSEGFIRAEMIYTGGRLIEEPTEETMIDDEGNEVPLESDWIDPKIMKKALIELKTKKAELEKKEGTAKAQKASNISRQLKEEKNSANKTRKSRQLPKTDDYEDVLMDDEPPFEVDEDVSFDDVY